MRATAAARARRTPPRIREARDRSSALRRRHQRRRGAARALHRGTARAARRRRGGDDVRARLRDLAQRAARQGSSRCTASRCGAFRCAHERVPRDFGRHSEHVFKQRALDRRRTGVARERRPGQPRHDRLPGAGTPFDYAILFSYRYYHAWHAARRMPSRAVLVPTAERDPAVALGDLRSDLPRRPRGHVQLAGRARDDPGASAATPTCPAWSSASGSDVPSRTDPARFRRKFRINRPFAIYIGRIDENKGCKELFDYLPALRGDVPARPRPGAGRQRGDADPETSAHPPSRLPQRRGQVRRAGRLGPADHAVVLREPVDGGARSLGARPSGAGQRPLRRAARASASAATPGSITSATRSSSRRCIRSNRTGRCTRGSGRTAASTSAATTRGR